MIIPDANLLVFAHNRAAARHERARAWPWDQHRLPNAATRLRTPPVQCT
jgi:hypothetical protein